MPISRGQMERQLRMGGGIMQVAPRQGALLGGLKKAVKGVAKGIGSFLKSDLGKAALLGVGAFGFPSIGSFGGFKGLLTGNVPQLGLKELLTKKAADVTLGDTLKVGAMGTVLGGVLSTLDPQEEEEIVQKRNLAALKSKLTKAYQDLNYDPSEIPALVANDMSEYTAGAGGYAEGGRIGFANGAQFTSGGNISPGTDAKGNVRDDNPYTGGGGGGGPSGPPSEPKKKRFKPFDNRFDFGKNIGVGLPPTELARFFNEFYGLPTVANVISMVNNQEDNNLTDEVDQSFNPNLTDPTGLITDVFNPTISDNVNKYKMGSLGLIDNQLLRDLNAKGGRIGYARGDTAEQNAMQAAGIEGLPLNKNPAGVTELDLRETGGFIPPVGVKEKADDIPAMLSNNEFVMTADAVREFGDGDVDKGAERMYAMMKTLENGGRV